jgi:hypothetical protein
MEELLQGGGQWGGEERVNREIWKNKSELEVDG